jgi:S-DNA-T family DNA segregation ATPase FtsK/SpoIIIE
MTVRTYYMPNPEWRTICARGRALRVAAGTLAGQAAGDDTVRPIDPATVVKALGAGTVGETVDWADELPDPLAAVVEYLGDELRPDGREFVPTAELIEALDVEPTMFGRQMGELGCRPTRHYVPDGDSLRRVRGYLTADIRAAIDEMGTRQATEVGAQ